MPPEQSTHSLPPQNGESKPRLSLGIYNELDRLKQTTTWGPVGAEAVLASLYPTDVSLFYDDMNVLRAREEGLKYSRFLESNGVQVVQVRDTLAGLLPVDHLDHKGVRHGIVAKARHIARAYGSTIHDDVYNGRPAEDVALELLEADVARYGEGPALALNEALSLAQDLPLGNAIYSRDQMNVLLDTRVVSRMAREIRKPEVALYERAYDELLGEHSKIELPEGETFEGGDAYIYNNTVYIGVGTRTTMGAAVAIYEQLREKLNERDMRFAIVEDVVYKDLPPEEQQQSMHLDTFSGPIGDKQIAVCLEEAEKREVKFLGSDDEGKTIVNHTFMNFIEHLKAEGNNIYVIPKAEQYEFGCNFLMLDDQNVVLPLKTNISTNMVLEEAGKDLHFVDLYQTTRGYGAAHCITGQQRRE